jgi:acetate kinase
MRTLLTVNAGSSSIKVCIYAVGDARLDVIATAKATNIGSQTATMVSRVINNAETATAIGGKHSTEIIDLLLTWSINQAENTELFGIGHRIVHGGPLYTMSERVTDVLLDNLRSLMSFDPDHLPIALQLIDGFREKLPLTPQVVVFDTAFFHTIPQLAQIVPLPYKYRARGLRRYGFHGLSYTYLLSALEERYGQGVAQGKLILAHLGSGASLAAIRNGQPIDMTMGFTPASGIMMSTRSGDIDPGVGSFLYKEFGVSAETLDHITNHESGLLGVSGLSADMYTLIQAEPTNTHAAEAIALFCYQVRKAIGALSASLGGLDTLVFSGGIGEPSSLIRERICGELAYLNIRLDKERNAVNGPVISTNMSPVTVYVIPTDENYVIAHETGRIITT